jgi:hypothetical protein
MISKGCCSDVVESRVEQAFEMPKAAGVRHLLQISNGPKRASLEGARTFDDDPL